MLKPEYTTGRNTTMNPPHFFNYIDFFATSAMVIVALCLTIAAIRALVKRKYGFGSWYRTKYHGKRHFGWSMLVTGVLGSFLCISRYSANLARHQEYVSNGVRTEGVVIPAHDRQTYVTIFYRDRQNTPYHLQYTRHSELDETKPICLYYKANNPRDAFVITYRESYFNCMIGLTQGGCWVLFTFVALVILRLNRKNGSFSI